MRRRKAEKLPVRRARLQKPRIYRPFAVVAALALVGAGSLLLGRSGQRGPNLLSGSTPNILLISIDTLRADHLGVYGAKVPTPAIDRLAGGGLLFEKAVAHVPITLPSHASLLTGTYPIAHGVRDNGAFRLRDELETLAETFRAAGYRTAAFVSSFALDSRFGLNQGFELYDDYYGDKSDFNDFTISERPADAVLEPALAWLGNHRNERWFAFIHLYDPHAPYRPPPDFRQGFRSHPYTSEVAYVDDALGRFLARLRDRGSLNNTALILTADHGEGLGEHGEKTHGMFAYESTLRVPLIFFWPGVLPAGVRVASRVRLIDVAPTLVELAGLGRSPEYQGSSLVPLMQNPSKGQDRQSYFEAMAFNLNRNWAPLTGLYQDRYKYINLPIPELYDLKVDPAEKQNLCGSRPGLARQMAAALDHHVALHSTQRSRRIEVSTVEEETAARLRTLGYTVAARVPRTPSRYTPEDDPKRLVALSDMLDEGIAAHLAGRSEEAIQIFRKILARRPNFSNVYANLAYVLRESGRLAEAIKVLEQAVELGLETLSMRGRLGAYLQEAGRFEQSAALLELAINEDPSYAEAYNYLAVSYARMGRTEEAVKTIEKLLALDPSYATAYSNLGSVYLGRRSYLQAERYFRRALEIDPRLPGAWNGLGVVYTRTGREPEAISAWQRALELDNRQYDTLFNLGTLLTRFNRFEEALPYLEQFARAAPADRYAADVHRVKRLVARLKAKAGRLYSVEDAR